jgi:hypothetical protein
MERLDRWCSAPASPSSPDSAFYELPMGLPRSGPASCQWPAYQSTPMPMDAIVHEPITPINHLSQVEELSDDTLVAIADAVEEEEAKKMTLEDIVLFYIAEKVEEEDRRIAKCKKRLIDLFIDDEPLMKKK